MKTNYILLIIGMFLFAGCSKPQTCPEWNAEGYNTVASAICNYKDTDSEENVMVTGWMYEKHSTGNGPC